MIRRVVMLCFDALEHDMLSVFPNLTQKQYFKIAIPRNALTIIGDHLVPYTPVMWKIILTGKIEGDQPTTFKSEHWKNPVINFLKHMDWLDRAYAFLLEHNIIKAGLPQKFGFKRKDYLAEDKSSIIHYAKNPIVIHNPLTASPKWQAYGIHSDHSFEEIERAAQYIFFKEASTALDALDKDWDLFIFYTKFLDIIGHLFWGQRKVLDYYAQVDNFVRRAKEIVQDAFVIVVSDHGMMPAKVGGQHSYHAFASFSEEVDYASLTVTDIYKIVANQLGVRSYG